MAQIDIASVNQEKRRVALYSIVAGVCLTLFKIVVAFSTGSLAILAESAHSALDLLSAITTFAAVRISARPADESHNFGHGKFENLSALVEMLLLLVTIAWILYEAIQRLFFRPVLVDASIWAFAVMGVSILIDFSRSRALSIAAKKYHSQALEADGLNYRNDLISSLITIIGLILVRLSQASSSLQILQHADSIAALGLVVILTVVSSRLGKEALDVLLDRAPDLPLGEISRSVEALPGVMDSHALRVRQSGPDTFVDVHVTMDPQMPLVEVHRLMGQVEQTIQKIVPGADVDVHPEPQGETHPDPLSNKNAER